jgi:hypothetical protein
MSSVTDDKIEGALLRYWKEIEVFYDKVFVDVSVPDNSEVWERLSEMEADLMDALAKRPLTTIEIRAVMAEFTRRCKKLFLDAKESGRVVARSGSPAG